MILAVLPEARNELAVFISTPLRKGNTATCVDFKAVTNRLQRCVDLAGLWDSNSRPPAHEVVWNGVANF